MLPDLPSCYESENPFDNFDYNLFVEMKYFYELLKCHFLVNLGCGSITSQNNTYLSSSNIETTTNSCTYTICKCDPNVCRIKFDFQMFDIAAPVEGTAVTTADGNGAFIADQTNGDAIGDCVTDSFSITSPGNVGTPVICGFNSGQHSKYSLKF